MCARAHCRHDGTCFCRENSNVVTSARAHSRPCLNMVQSTPQCVLPSHRTVWQNFLHCVAKVFALCSKFFCTVWQSFPGRVSWKGFYSEMEVYVAMQHLPQVGDRNGLTSLSYLRLLPPTSPFFTKVIQLFLLLCASCTKRLIPNGHLQFLSI